MSLFCKRNCRKCFPNGCCGYCKPPPQVQLQKATVIQLEKSVKEKYLKYGGILFFPGVRTAENQYTSPMLSVHLYKYSQHKANTGEGERGVAVQGTVRESTHNDTRNLKAEDRANATEEIIMIPVEDVVSIGSKLKVKKSLQANIETKTIPTYGFRQNCWDDCWNSTKTRCQNTCSCCQKPIQIAPLVHNTTILFNDPNQDSKYHEEDLPLPQTNKSCTDCCRCWCCKKRVLTRLLQKTYTKEKREAERMITVTIQYSQYSNLNTPSHTRLLSAEHQSAYYKEKFNTEKELEFYLVNDIEFDPANFDLRKAEAETLCRTVMQLKGMKGHYPTESELDQILGLGHRKVFGDLYTEPILHIPMASPLHLPIPSPRSNQPTLPEPQQPADDQ